MLGVYSTYPKPGKVVDVYVENKYYGKLLEIRYDVKFYYKQDIVKLYKLPSSLLPGNIGELDIKIDEDLDIYINQPAILRPTNNRAKISFITVENEGQIKRLGIPKMRDDYMPMFDDYMIN